jgi:hypothetical protein
VAADDPLDLSKGTVLHGAAAEGFQYFGHRLLGVGEQIFCPQGFQPAGKTGKTERFAERVSFFEIMQAIEQNGGGHRFVNKRQSLQGDPLGITELIEQPGGGGPVSHLRVVNRRSS